MNIIAAIQNGDRFLFEQVFNEYHEKLYFYVLSKTKSTYIAEEVTQLTFIKLWQYRTHLNPDINPSIQIFRIAKTTLIDVLRKQNNVAKLHFNITAINPNTTGNNIDETINQKELQQKLQDAIQQMPAVRRKVFELSRIEGLSYKEIAAELSLSIKTVEHHIALALKQLRHFMGLIPAMIVYFFS